ncbi:DUF6461 domain-containing protein [Actinokineospora inagensis]|uniref:DUF6461 domain-containing protein n=1 Tax=Actinokineospora inagensis TaxID=103730 RepID=UPI00040F05D9|nr:DUF6461 domain-containing protein [Actinokineospora inagensis]
MQHYAWADEDYDLCLTVAVVTGQSVAEVVRAYGGDPARTPDVLPFPAAVMEEDEVGSVFLPQVREVEGRVVVIENIGWLGTTGEVATRASMGGEFVCVHWDLNAHSRIVEAVDGQVVATFEPLIEEAPPGVGEVFGQDALNAEMLAWLEQRSGVGFDRAWLTEPAATYRVVL